MACSQCRISKKKCTVVPPNVKCLRCLKKGLPCSLSPSNTNPPNNAPMKLSNTFPSTPQMPTAPIIATQDCLSFKLACSQCRLAKKKCILHTPSSCQRCMKKRLPCSFASSCTTTPPTNVPTTSLTNGKSNPQMGTAQIHAPKGCHDNAGGVSVVFCNHGSHCHITPNPALPSVARNSHHPPYYTRSSPKHKLGNRWEPPSNIISQLNRPYGIHTSKTPSSHRTQIAASFDKSRKNTYKKSYNIRSELIEVSLPPRFHYLAWSKELLESYTLVIDGGLPTQSPLLRPEKLPSNSLPWKCLHIADNELHVCDTKNSSKGLIHPAGNGVTPFIRAPRKVALSMTGWSSTTITNYLCSSLSAGYNAQRSRAAYHGTKKKMSSGGKYVTFGCQASQAARRVT